MYVRPSQMTTSVVVRVLARALPGRVPAPASGAGGSLSSAGRHPGTGRWYSQYEIFNGGAGARPDADGAERHGRPRHQRDERPGRGAGDRIPDARRGLRAGAGFGRPRDSSAAASASAANGASWPRNRPSICAPTASSIPRPASSAPSPRSPLARVLNPGTPEERPLTSKVAGLRLKQGDLVVWELGGGGGYGDPKTRDPARVRARRGATATCRSRRRASDYGVALRPRRPWDRRGGNRRAAQAGARPDGRARRDRRRRHLHRRHRLRRRARREVVLIEKYTSNAADPMRVMDAITRDLAAEFGAAGGRP